MMFRFPLGLLGLIAVPILILIYLLKRKYQEHIVPSSYLWELSNRFLKRRIKTRNISELLSLILQLSVVVLLSFSLAGPIFKTSKEAENICFILDASGSMHIKMKEHSRFDEAKKEMFSLVNHAPKGSTFTLLYAGKDTKVIANKVENKDVFYQLCADLQPEYTHISLSDSIEFASNWIEEHQLSKVYALTDQTFDYVENVELLTFSNHEENYATYDLSVEEKDDILSFSGKLISYESDANLTIELYVDDLLMGNKAIETMKGIESNFIFEIPLQDYRYAEIRLQNDDALFFDNYDRIYSIKEESQSSVLLVSEQPFYLSSIIKAIGKYSITVIEPNLYQEQENYDLYIFDDFTPNALPKSGSVWFLNSNQNIVGSGFIVQDEKITTVSSHIGYSEEHSSLYEQLTKDIRHNSIRIYKYKKYSIYQDFTTILQCDGLPILFAGTTETGLREAVFAFDLHDSDLPLLYDYAAIMRNLLNYSLPSPVEDKDYVVGDALQLNISSKVTSVRVTSPSLRVSFVPMTSQIVEFDLKEVGTYTIQYRMNDEVRDYNIFVGFPKLEGSTEKNESLIFVKASEKEQLKGTYDSLVVFLIVACVFFLVEWGVYSREQY